MTAAVWARGMKNAFICGVIVFTVLGILAFAVSAISGKPTREGYGLAFAIFWVFIFTVFAIDWFRGRKISGSVLLDCGPHPTRALFLLNAVVFLLLGATGGFTGHASRSDMFASGSVLFGLTFSIYWVIISFGRLQIREKGIWQYTSLLKWEKLKSYEWEGNTLKLQARTLFPLLGRGALPVPPERKTALDNLLKNLGQQI